MLQHMFAIVINDKETEENTTLVRSDGLCGHDQGTNLIKRLNPGIIQLLEGI